MHIAELLSTGRIRCQAQGSSKKHSLEMLSSLLASSLPDFSNGELFDSLIGRERLGSTGLGRGVALPHGRLNGLHEPLAAFMTLETGIDYDAIDRQPVDLLFALLVPEESTEEHLQILAQLAGMFNDRDFCTALRSCSGSQQCLDQFTNRDAYQKLSA
jgi:PTS system nitrogen regulatory IIA component